MFNKINSIPGKHKLIVYIVLTIATLAVYWQLHQHSFIVYDDYVYVTANRYVQSGITLDGIHWAFVTTYAEFWHPLTWISLMFDSQLYGLNAGGYHMTNLILHILSTLLLFWLFCRMTGAIWKSAFVAAFFALHPLHVESVAWIAERKDVLSAFFWMLTLCFYVYYTEKPAIRRYLPVIFSFACALMSKSMVVTLPVIMILLDYWPLGRFESKRNNWFLWQFKEKIPLFILSAFFSLITLFAQYSQPLKIYPLSSRIKNTPVSFVTYLEKIFWPHNLILFYPFSEQLPLGQVLGAVSLIFIISTAVIIMMKRLPYLFVGWLWYAITILPVIGIIQPGSHFADRYTYLPSIGIVIMLAWGIPLLFRREDIRKKILFPSSIAILAIMSFFTWQQCGYWKNDIELSKHLLRVTNDIDIKYLDMTPQNAGDYNNRGNAYAKSRDYQHSIEDYSQAILMKPDCAEYYYNRGTTFGEIDQYQRALKDFGKAVLLKPDYVDVYFSTGTVYAKLGQYQHAIESYNQAILLKPDYALAYSNRGFAYLLKGEKSLGCRDAQTSCALGNCQFLEMVKKEGFCR